MLLLLLEVTAGGTAYLHRAYGVCHLPSIFIDCLLMTLLSSPCSETAIACLA